MNRNPGLNLLVKLVLKMETCHKKEIVLTSFSGVIYNLIN